MEIETELTNNNDKEVESMNDNETTTEIEFMLSLIDNPFDYFTDFREWLKFDIEHSQRFNHPTCCEYLARVVNLEDDMNQKEKDEEIERAIDEIILYDYRNLYKKISKTMEVIEPIPV